MMKPTIVAAVALAGWAISVAAQDEGPAVQTSEVGRALPAGEPAARQDRADDAQTEGTVIVGDRESPIGLYIMPWRESKAAEELDRPARLVTADRTPIDRPVLLRELAYYRALTGALEERNLVTPELGRPPAESP